MSANQPDVAYETHPRQQRHRHDVEALLQPGDESWHIRAWPAVRDDRFLAVIVGVEAVTPFGESLNDGLDVPSSTKRHLVANLLRLDTAIPVVHSGTQLTKLVPHLTAVPGTVTIHPSR
jgi:hypothetical protein